MGILELIAKACRIPTDQAAAVLATAKTNIGRQRALRSVDDGRVRNRVKTNGDTVPTVRFLQNQEANRDA